MTIETKRLKLISCDIETLIAAIEGNEIVAKKINAILVLQQK